MRRGALIKTISLLFWGILLSFLGYSEEGIVSGKAEIVYKKVGNAQLKLHVFYPKYHNSSAKAPCVVSFFGGGWVSGTPRQFFQQSKYFANKGMVAISAEYRIKNKHKTTPFECVMDGKSAIRYVRMHADELGIDPNRVVAAGGSAGGHVAACTGVISGYDEEGENLSVSSVPDAMMLFNPVIDTTAKGYGAEKVKGRETEISPCHHVKAGLPPTIIFHGTADKTVPLENVQRFTDLMHKAGNNCQLVPFQEQGHGFFNGKEFRPKSDNKAFEQTVKTGESFLKRLGILDELPKELKLPAIISDNMMLQAGERSPIWGWVAPGKKVTVSFQEHSLTSQADSQGKWLVEFTDLKAGGPYEMKVEADKVVVIRNILVGEVWGCSGQSNMQWPVRAAKNAKQEIKKANYPEVRLFRVPNRGTAFPQKDVRGSWQVCTPQSVAGFSAVGYFFGRKLHSDLKTPVGLIQSAYGGASAEAWTPKEMFQKSPYAAGTMKRYHTMKANYDNKVRTWQKNKKGRRPGLVKGIREQHVPANCFNAMLNPVIPYGIRGVIWYQGEYNTDFPEEYYYTFSSMIKAWRQKWQKPDMPFYFVQLANFKKRQARPVESNWAELRDAQTKTLTLPHTGMAVTIDIGEAGNIHPKNKQDVGLRLAYNALAKTYGKDIVYSGPIVSGAVSDKGKVVINFKYLAEGLKVNGEALKGFAVAGADKKFYWATAELKGSEVLCWSNEVPEPVYVSYAWADNPDCNLYNSAGLPAVPFRIELKKENDNE